MVDYKILPGTYTGLFIPPFSTLSMQADEHAIDAEPGREKLLELYEKGYAEDTAQMVA